MGDVLLAQEFALSFYERAVLNVANAYPATYARRCYSL